MCSARKLFRLSISLLMSLILFSFILGPGCSSDSTTEPVHKVQADYSAPRLSTAPVLDGQDTDEVWQSVPWGSIASWIEGDSITNTNDFMGRYKIGWTEDKLYILIDIIDDNFSSCYEEIDAVSNDDCVALFIDEDHSGGPYQVDHQAFAYFIELDSSVVGFTTSPDSNFVYFNDHVDVAQVQNRDRNTWELAVTVFTSAYSESFPAELNLKAVLESGKQMGLTVGYFDADLCQFNCLYGSCPQLEEENTMIWENADHFGAVVLTD